MSLKATGFSKDVIEKLLNFQLEIQKEEGKQKKILGQKEKKEEVKKRQ